jgi:hypothetical protein
VSNRSGCTMNRGLAARIFDLSARIGGLVACVVCGKGREVSVPHVSDGDRTGLVIVGMMRFGGTRASGRDDVMVVRTTVVVVVVVGGGGHGEYGGGGGVWFGEL